MNGSNIALDTNEAIAVLNDAGDTGQWIAALCVQHGVPLARMAGPPTGKERNP